MSKKYKTILITIIVFLICDLIIAGGYKVYKYYDAKKNSAEVVIDEELSINYLDGRSLNFNDKEKEITFSVINDSDNESMFHIILENIKLNSSKITYSLYENDVIVINSTELLSGTYNTISSFVNIEANGTKSYKLIISNPENDNIKFDIDIVKASQEDPNFSQTILNNNSINKETKTTVGQDIAVVDEGLILDIDDNGNTFYFRGNVKNNYVNFANKMWRIVKINGDGTVKLVLDSVLDKSTIYSDSLSGDKLNTLEKLTNNNTYAYLENWYKENLSDYDHYIAEGKFCIDVTKEGDNLANYFRVNLANTPTFNCTGNKNSSKIGLLTIDEIIYAGATINEQNQYYYLYNSDITDNWWTISPAKEAVEGIYYYEVGSNGGISLSATGESSKAIRPVINLLKEVEMTGEGTIDSPYTLK